MTFVPNTAGINRLVNDPNGPTGRYLERLADRVVAEAEGLAPVGDGASGQHLWQSIDRTAAQPGRGGLVVRVRALRPYAAAVVHGAKPHIIRARNARALRFKGRGGVVFAKSVSHPGNAANNFLARALHRIVGGI